AAMPRMAFWIRVASSTGSTYCARIFSIASTRRRASCQGRFSAAAAPQAVAASASAVRQHVVLRRIGSIICASPCVTGRLSSNRGRSRELTLPLLYSTSPQQAAWIHHVAAIADREIQRGALLPARIAGRSNDFAGLHPVADLLVDRLVVAVKTHVTVAML